MVGGRNKTTCQPEMQLGLIGVSPTPGLRVFHQMHQFVNLVFFAHVRLGANIPRVGLRPFADAVGPIVGQTDELIDITWQAGQNPQNRFGAQPRADNRGAADVFAGQTRKPVAAKKPGGSDEIFSLKIGLGRGQGLRLVVHVSNRRGFLLRQQQHSQFAVIAPHVDDQGSGQKNSGDRAQAVHKKTGPKPTVCTIRPRTPR